MPTRFEFKLPPVFNTAKHSAIQSRAVMKAASDTVLDIQNEMENSPHTGKVVRRRGRRHQQSRRGERPAPFTKNLKRSVKKTRISEHEIEIKPDAEYTERLIKLGRVIISESDEKKAGERLQRGYENELKSLV